jgi:microcystin degradation protein MlrC
LTQGSAVEPMRGLWARAEARTGAARLERISLLPGFPYSDVSRCGFGICAVARSDRADAALAVVRETFADVGAHIPDFRVDCPPPREAVRRALAAPRKPVILADVADNIGGGAPGDGTILLAELLAQRAEGAIVLLADGEAVRAAHAAGPGAILNLALGAHSDLLHGEPLEVMATVLRLGDGDYVAGGTWMTGQSFSMGSTAVLGIDGGVTVLVMERATPPFHIEQLTSNGIDPSAASMIVAKGAVAWRSAYEAIMAEAIAVNTPGCCPADPKAMVRHNTPIQVAPGIFSGPRS